MDAPDPAPESLPDGYVATLARESPAATEPPLYRRSTAPPGRYHSERRAHGTGVDRTGQTPAPDARERAATRPGRTTSPLPCSAHPGGGRDPAAAGRASGGAARGRMPWGSLPEQEKSEISLRAHQSGGECPHSADITRGRGYTLV